MKVRNCQIWQTGTERSGIRGNVQVNLRIKGCRLNVRWGKPQQSGHRHNSLEDKTTPVPGLPGPLPNPGQVAQHDPAKRAKFAQDVPKPMGAPIDLPTMGKMKAPRAPSEFLPPDSAKGNTGPSPVSTLSFYFAKKGCYL